MEKKRKKHGGRKKGTPNKDVAQIRQHLTNLLAGQQEKLFNELELLEGKDYIQAVTGLMKFAVPTLKSVDIGAKEGAESPIKIVIQKTYEKDGNS